MVLSLSKLDTMMNHYPARRLSPHQCGATLVQTLHAPLPLVWSFIRRFDRPEAYMSFVKSCTLRSGDGGVGSVREIKVVSGLPLARSTERLDKLDDELHIMVYSVIDGDHRLVNYKSTTTLHEVVEEGGGGGKKTLVIESYVVDVPEGNSKEDTCTFINTILGNNLKSLVKICEKIAASDF